MSALNIFGLLSGFFGSAYIIYTFWGYDKKDVDVFMSEIIDSYEELYKGRRQRTRQNQEDFER